MVKRLKPVENPVEDKPAKSRIEVVDSVKQFRRFCQSVIDLADAVGDADSLERSANEAKLRAENARQEEAMANAALLAAQDELAKAQRKKAEAEQTAARVILDARLEAAALRASIVSEQDTAKTQAQALTDAARSEADAIKAQATTDAEAIANEANADKADVEGKIKALKKTHGDWEKKVAAKTAEHEALEAKIADAKARIAELLA